MVFKATETRGDDLEKESLTTRIELRTESTGTLFRCVGKAQELAKGLREEAA